MVLEDLEVRVAARRTPPAWNVYQMSQGCGGGLTPAVFAVNLDAPRPLARPVAGNDAGNGRCRPPRSRCGSRRPSRSSCGWRRSPRAATATGPSTCAGPGPSGSGTLRIDDNGRPLRTSAATGRPVYGYATGTGPLGPLTR